MKAYFCIPAGGNNFGTAVDGTSHLAARYPPPVAAHGLRGGAVNPGRPRRHVPHWRERRTSKHPGKWRPSEHGPAEGVARGAEWEPSERVTHGAERGPTKGVAHARGAGEKRGVEGRPRERRTCEERVVVESCMNVAEERIEELEWVGETEWMTGATEMGSEEGIVLERIVSKRATGTPEIRCRLLSGRRPHAMLVVELA